LPIIQYILFQVTDNLIKIPRKMVTSKYRSLIHQTSSHLANNSY